MMKLPESKADYFPLQGGLDMVSPAIAVPPGRVYDSQNYEPEISGGYRRIDGYERYDGRALPSSRAYWILRVTLSATVAVGATVAGAVSTATGKVLALETGALVLGALTGSFDEDEGITVGGLPVGTVITSEAEEASQDLAAHALYRHLAANLQRPSILVVPGSGPIRGVWIYKDTLYAVRDNVGATASVIHKATPTGWQAITMGLSLQFDGATGEIAPGVTVVNQTGTASGVVLRSMLRTGTWTSAGAGTLVFASMTGTFADNDQIRIGATQMATANGTSAAIARLPGGRCEFVNANFTGSADTQKMYGADGVNPAFEFDGTTYVPIRTGMAEDKPRHITEHKGHLFLSFRGSIQHSAIGNPYAWTVVLGAGEIATGDVVTGFLAQSGSATGSALAILTRDRLFVLYGSVTDDWNLVPTSFDIGFSPYTVQQVSGDGFGVTARGVQALSTTQNYGDFSFNSVSHMVQPLMTILRGTETAANTLRSKGQYRVYFANGQALAVGLTGNKVTGLMVLNYGRAVRCIVTDTLASGEEVTYFGSDDGYVYRDSSGTSHDGEPIEAWCRLHFNVAKTPMVRKRFRRAVLDVKVDIYAEVIPSYDFAYGSPHVSSSAPMPERKLLGSGGFWDSATWDRFVWDSATVANTEISIDGTENNISFAFYSNRAQDTSHTLQGITLIYTPQRLSR